MALTVTSRGSGARNTGSESSYAITPGSNFTAGAMAVLCVAYDNSGTGGSDSYSSIADSHGNTWTPRINSLIDPGAANAGHCLRIFTTDQAVGTLTTGSTITVSFGATTVARSYTLYEITGSVGIPTYVTGGQETATTATPTITTVSITSGYAVIAAVGREGNGTRTADADTTNGNWANTQNNGVGTTTGGSEIISQSKVVTATATQTYNPTFGGTSRDGCEAYIIVREAENHTSSITLKDNAVAALAISAATTENHTSSITLQDNALASLAITAATTENHFSSITLQDNAVASNAVTAANTEHQFSTVTLQAASLDSLAITAETTEFTGNFSDIPLATIDLGAIALAAATTENQFSSIPLSAIPLAALAPLAATTENHVSSLDVSAISLAGLAPLAVTTSPAPSIPDSRIGGGGGSAGWGASYQSKFLPRERSSKTKVRKPKRIKKHKPAPKSDDDFEHVLLLLG